MINWRGSDHTSTADQSAMPPHRSLAAAQLAAAPIAIFAQSSHIF